MNKIWLFIGIIGVLLGISVLVILSMGYRISTIENKISQPNQASVGSSITPRNDTTKEVKKSEKESEEASSMPEGPLGLKKALELEGSGNKKTDIFSVGEGDWMITFLIMDDKFSAEEPSYQISLYKIGNTNPIWASEDRTDLALLKEHGWNPSEITIIGLGEGKQGVVGGIRNSPPFSGPGEFYFEIQVKNIDRWFLRVEENFQG